MNDKSTRDRPTEDATFKLNAQLPPEILSILLSKGQI